MNHVSRNTYQTGQIIIIAGVFMLILIILITGLVSYAGVQIKGHRQALSRVQGLNIAEAAIELAVWKLNNQQGYTGETGTAYGNGTFNVTITNLSGNQKLVKVDSFVPNAANPQAKRTVQVTVTLGATNISFNYGVQVDSGGIEMENNSQVTGNVYSNGNIIGDNSGVRIAGTAIAAGATGKIDEINDIDGDAAAHFLEDVSVDGSTNSASLLQATVGGNAVSDSISDCTIGGNATYDTKTSCTIGGTQTTPNPANFDDPDVLSLPISDEQIQDWKDEAEAGGVVTSQTIDGTASLGPKKINGNLTITNGATLTMTGTIWVTGNISIDNNATVVLDPSYGSLSGVIVNDGWIHFDNNGLIGGSGTAGSYLMFLNTLACTGSSGSGCTHHSAAVDLHNNVGAAIVYVKSGLVHLHNGVNVKELTAYKIHLSNTASVTYESGLANAQFSSGPGGGWEVLDGTWQLLQ
ncbi:MAG: hypothetical protein HYV13_03295 [Candidatus Doudnabacteria bacterium]|nr:hypothetical protein [Candidatus Doudnabacteria bacterium]